LQEKVNSKLVEPEEMVIDKKINLIARAEKKAKR